MEDNKLQIIVKDSGLEQTKSQILLTKFSDYFSMAAEWEAKAKAIQVTNESQLAEMDMARVGRLFLREKRIQIEKTRKELKEQALREGKAIDGIANILKAVIEPIEEYLYKQEKFAEIKQAEKEEAERKEAERKAEEERIAKEKAYAEELAKKQRENEKLRKEAEQREAEIRKEKEKAEKERIAREKQIAAEKEKLRKEAEKKLEAERAEKRKAEEALAKKLETEKKAKEEEERKAEELKFASDSEKIQLFIEALVNLPIPTVKSKKRKEAVEKATSYIQLAIKELKK